MTTEERARAALQAGDATTAHRILQGRIGEGSYSSETYRLYGEALARLDDRHEAGKYLFLGGETEQNDEAVGAYLRRSGRESWRQLWATFPNRVRHLPLEALPSTVREKLIELGAPDTYPLRASPRQPATEPVGDHDAVGGAILLAILIALLWLLGRAVSPPN